MKFKTILHILILISLCSIASADDNISVYSQAPYTSVGTLNLELFTALIAFLVCCAFVWKRGASPLTILLTVYPIAITYSAHDLYINGLLVTVTTFLNSVNSTIVSSYMVTTDGTMSTLFYWISAILVIFFFLQCAELFNSIAKPKRTELGDDD
jgi:hypothetical protein